MSPEDIAILSGSTDTDCRRIPGQFGSFSRKNLLQRSLVFRIVLIFVIFPRSFCMRVCVPVQIACLSVERILATPVSIHLLEVDNTNGLFR